MSAPFAAAFPFPKIMMRPMDVLAYPGLADTGEDIQVNLQPATFATNPRRTAQLPAEYFGPTTYHGYTDDLGPIPPKGPWHSFYLSADGLYYKIVLVKQYPNHYFLVMDEVRNA